MAHTFTSSEGSISNISVGINLGAFTGFHSSALSALKEVIRTVARRRKMCMFRETKNRIKDLDEVNPAFSNPFIPGIKNKKPAII